MRYKRNKQSKVHIPYNRAAYAIIKWLCSRSAGFVPVIIFALGMASKSVLKLRAIHDFFGDYAPKARRRGENALESGHLASFLYDGECSHIEAKVKASQRKTAYKVTVDFTPVKIVDATCNCVRGLVSCHHMAAVMLHANKALSVTDKSCSWSVKNPKRTASAPSPIEMIRPPPKTFRALKDNPFNKEVKMRVQDGIKDCGAAAVSVAWLLSPEPEQNISTENTFNLPKPIDAILSKSFEDAPCKLSYLEEMLSVSQEVIEQVAAATTGQSENPLWIYIRELRITASNFGAILSTYTKKKNCGVPSPSLLKKLYAPPNLDKIKVVLWGRDHEKTALKLLSEKYGISARPTGIWLHQCGFLGASPDGLVGEDAIVEVKCPFSLRNNDLCEALAVNKDYVVHYADGNWVLNTKHDYYHQIQGQLFILKKSVCFLLIWTTKSMVVLNVPFNPDWSQNDVLLKKFYCDHFVPFVRKEESLKKTY